MNAQLLNPFARDTPERIEGTLENASAHALAFNAGRGLFAGCYLAVGRTDGLVVIWDIETRSILRWFGGHAKCVTSVSWSPLSRYLASASLDWCVHIWDLANGPAQCVRTLRFTAPVSLVQFSPVSSRSLVVVLESREAYLIHFPTTLQGPTCEPQRIPLQGTDPISSACFAPSGDWIFIGTTKGGVASFSSDSGELFGEAFTAGLSMIRQMTVDRRSQNLGLAMNDRTIRTFTMYQEKPRTPPTFASKHKFQDIVGRTPWNGVSFSSDSEYVMGGAAQDTAHNVYIWDRDAGVLVKILEGPREPLSLALWHPSRLQLASVSSSGDIYLWTTQTTENWSAYAPGFEELERNVEYEERETEFDLDDLDQIDRQRHDDEAATVNLFANGPLPQESLPPVLQTVDLRRTTSTLAPQLMTSEAAHLKTLEDDDNQVGFFIPPLLEEYRDEEIEQDTPS